MQKITNFSKGDRIRLMSFGKTEKAYKRRLLSLGLTCGAEASIVRFAPLGCPVQLEIRGTFITIRKEEADDLLWERL